jgi:hypothetical protein
LPSRLSGLVALRTSRLRSSDLTVAFTAFLLSVLVSLSPRCASSTTGLVPLACFGSFASSRSVASVEFVPGRLRLLLVSLPTLSATREIATARTIQIATTTRRWRAHSRPSG